MDPIHPIVPSTPKMPSVGAAPVTSRIDRDKRREQGAGKDRRPGAQRRSEDEGDEQGDAVADGPHIDLTA